MNDAEFGVHPILPSQVQGVPHIRHEDQCFQEPWKSHHAFSDSETVKEYRDLHYRLNNLDGNTLSGTLQQHLRYHQSNLDTGYSFMPKTLAVAALQPIGAFEKIKKQLRIANDFEWNSLRLGGPQDGTYPIISEYVENFYEVHQRDGGSNLLERGSYQYHTACWNAITTEWEMQEDIYTFGNCAQCFRPLPLGTMCPRCAKRSKRIYFERDPQKFQAPEGALIHPVLKNERQCASPFALAQAVRAPIYLYLDYTSFEYADYVKYTAVDKDRHHIVMSPLDLLKKTAPILKFHENLVNSIIYFTGMHDNNQTISVIEHCLFQPDVLNARQLERQEYAKYLRDWNHRTIE